MGAVVEGQETRRASVDGGIGFIGVTARDPGTGLLTKSGFLRLVGGLRHGDIGAFAVVRVQLDGDGDLRDAADGVRLALAPGDVAARFGNDAVVVLRHPVVGDEPERFAAHVRTAVVGADVSVARSTEPDDTPWGLLTPAPRAIGSEGRDGAARRHATPAGA